MKGWGSVSLFLALGVFMGAGCGGRTGVLYDEDYEPNEQAGTGSGNTGNNGTGGSVGTAGRPGRAGSRNTGGAGPIPTGGVSSFGGAYPGGAYPGGAYPGGTGYGGYPFGGTTGIGGAFMMGGFGGVPPNDCQTCIFQTCGDPLTQCLQDFGCLSILACTQATGCDAFQCYNPQTCGPIIDQWGGPGGPSMSMLLRAFSCVVTSGCPCN
jgi:hypothetical protein